MRRSRWSYLAAGGVLGAVLLSAAREPTSDQPYTEAIEPLIAALGPYRFIEPRLTGGFEPAPCAEPGPLPPAEDDLVPEPDCAGDRTPSPRDLARALRDLEAARADLEPLSAARVAMLMELVGGRTPEGLRAAIDHLEREAKRAGSAARADVWSDLAAARLVLAQRADEPELILEAFNAAEEALHRDDHHLAAHFNRALALEYFGLAGLARQAWDEYRELDTDPASATEADARLSRIEEELRRATRRAEVAERLEAAVRQGDVPAGLELVRREPASARRLLEREILPAWGRAVRGGDTAGAGLILGTVRSMVEALQSIDGDALLAESLAAIDAAEDPENRAALARGHATFGDGMALYTAPRIRRPDLAEPEFVAAQQALAAGRSPFAHLATLYRAICEYHGRRGDSAARLANLERQRELVRFPSLRGRLLWQTGLVDAALGDRARALDRFAAAREAFLGIGDLESVVSVDDLAASVFDTLGDQSRAWRYRWQALRGLSQLTDTRRRWVVVKATGESLAERGRPHLALAVLDELVALSGDDHEILAQALLRRAEIRSRLDHGALAARDHEEVQTAVARLSDPDLRARIEVDALVSRAKSLTGTDPEHALRLFDEPGRFYQSTGNVLLLGRVHLARARAALAAGREREAERWLGQAIALAEREWSQTRDPSLRTTFLGELRATFDELILCQYRDDPALAFATAERARARVLLDHTGERPLDATEVRESLAPGTVLVEYAQIGDRLLTWVVTRDGVQPVSTEAGAVRKLAEAAAQESDEAALRRHLAALYDLLVRPVAAQLPPEALVVFVPDGLLGAIPFAALFDRTSGRFLVQDHLLVVAPSASVHVAAQRRARELGRRPPRSVLAVGDPAFDREWHPSLPRLPEAGREAESIAALFPEGTPLLDSAATPAAVGAAVTGHDVVHFAAHAILDAGAPERSALALAPAGSDPGSGDLTAEAIERLPLGRTRLVVLASCSGAGGPAAAGEGTLSLARSFLAGAPTVVASVWPVDDAEAADLFNRFYGSILAGDDPVAALRKAQLESLASPDHDLRSPRAWGGFQALGAEHRR